MTRRAPILLGLWFLLNPSSAIASWPSNPSVNVGVGVGPGTQQNGRSVSDGQGGAFLVWEENRFTSVDIYVRMIKANGEQWPSIGVGVGVTSENETGPRIVSDGVGGAIVIWHAPAATRAQRLDADGNTLWDEGGMDVTTFGGRPEAIADGEGGVIVTWIFAGAIFAQRLAANGGLLWPDGGVELVSGGDKLDELAITSDGTGGAIVAWARTIGTDEDIFAQRVSGDGQALWGASGAEVHVDVSDQDIPVLLGDGNGGAFVAYKYVDTWAHGRVQRLGPDGQRLWPAGGINPTTSTFDAGVRVMVPDGEGGVIIKWENAGRSHYHHGSDIHAQRLDGDGKKRWGANGIRVIDDDDHKRRGTMVGSQDGGAFFIWTTQPADSSRNIWDVYAQRVDANGTTLWSAPTLVCNARSTQRRLHLVLSTFDGIIAFWDDWRRDGDVMAQRVNADGTLGEEPTDVEVSDLIGVASGSVILLSWRLSDDAVREVRLVEVQKAPDIEGLWTPVAALLPSSQMEFEDTDGITHGGTYWYRLSLEVMDGSWVLSQPVEVSAAELRWQTGLEAPYASPGGPIEIRYSIGAPGPARLDVFDVAGRRVRTLTSGPRVPGYYREPWDRLDSSGHRTARGIYIVRLQAGDATVRRKITVLR